MFSDVDMGKPYLYHFQYSIAGTGVSLRWYWTGTQISAFLIFIGVHCRVSHHLFKHQFYHFLLLGSNPDDREKKIFSNSILSTIKIHRL